jgi:hypothetical protein
MASQATRSSVAGLAERAASPERSGPARVYQMPRLSRRGPRGNPRPGPTREQVTRWVLEDVREALRSYDRGVEPDHAFAWLFSHVDQLRQLVERSRS